MQRAKESVDSKWMNIAEDLQYRIIKEYREGSDASTNERMNNTFFISKKRHSVIARFAFGSSTQSPPWESKGSRPCS